MKSIIESINESKSIYNYNYIGVEISKKELQSIINDVTGDTVYLMFDQHDDEYGNNFIAKYDSSGRGEYGYFNDKGQKRNKLITKFEKEHFKDSWKDIKTAKINNKN